MLRWRRKLDGGAVGGLHLALIQVLERVLVVGVAVGVDDWSLLLSLWSASLLGCLVWLSLKNIFFEIDLFSHLIDLI